jgi:hypothetical protein
LGISCAFKRRTPRRKLGSLTVPGALPRHIERLIPPPWLADAGPSILPGSGKASVPVAGLLAAASPPPPGLGASCSVVARSSSFGETESQTLGAYIPIGPEIRSQFDIAHIESRAVASKPKVRRTGPVAACVYPAFEPRWNRPRKRRGPWSEAVSIGRRPRECPSRWRPRGCTDDGSFG